MAESNGGPVAYGALVRAVDGLRDDVREDIGHLRDDVREDNERIEQRVMRALTDYAKAHGADHEEMGRARDAGFSRMDTFIRNSELAQAKRDGALGAFRFVLDQLSRHGRVLLALGGGLLTFLAAISGALRIEVLIS